MIFQFFFCILINIGFFLYCKDTNSVLKYMIFVKTLKKKYFIFMHTAKSLKKKRKKKTILYFHITKKILKICISMHFDLYVRHIPDIKFFC
jgi:hypothetical protein